MKLFDMLFGRKERTHVELVPDRIWMTTEAKFAGLARDVALRSSSGSVAVLLVAHFPDVLSRLESIANEQDSNVPVRAVLAVDLNPDLAACLDLDESAIIDVIVGQRHPVPSVDDRLEMFADRLSCRNRFSHHLSLDDAVISNFAGDGVSSMLKKLGMTEHEAIHSQMMSRRIRQQQQKIEGRSFGNLNAESASEWLERNCPDLVKK